MLKFRAYKVTEERGAAVRAAAEHRAERQHLPPTCLTAAWSVTGPGDCHVAEAEE